MFPIILTFERSPPSKFETHHHWHFYLPMGFPCYWYFSGIRYQVYTKVVVSGGTCLFVSHLFLLLGYITMAAQRWDFLIQHIRPISKSSKVPAWGAIKSKNQGGHLKLPVEIDFDTASCMPDKMNSDRFFPSPQWAVREYFLRSFPPFQVFFSYEGCDFRPFFQYWMIKSWCTHWAV